MSTLGNQLSSNSFKQANCRGREDEKINFNKLPAKLVAEEGEIVSAGDLVKVVGGDDCLPVVAQASATNKDGLLGFLPLTRKKNSYENGDMATIDMEGCVMEMITSAALTGGDEVYYDARATIIDEEEEEVDNPNYGKLQKAPDSATDGIIKCGFALTDAVAGGLVRVKISF